DAALVHRRGDAGLRVEVLGGEGADDVAELVVFLAVAVEIDGEVRLLLRQGDGADRVALLVGPHHVLGGDVAVIGGRRAGVAGAASHEQATEGQGGAQCCYQKRSLHFNSSI